MSRKHDPGNAPQVNWRPLFFGFLVASLVVGTIGAAVCGYLGLPLYLGGLFGFTITGMTGLFALAARIARR